MPSDPRESPGSLRRLSAHAAEIAPRLEVARAHLRHRIQARRRPQPAGPQPPAAAS